MFPQVSLKLPSVVLSIYIGEALSVLGKMDAKVDYKEIRVTASL